MTHDTSRDVRKETDRLVNRTRDSGPGTSLVPTQYPTRPNLSDRTPRKLVSELSDSLLTFVSPVGHGSGSPSSVERPLLGPPSIHSSPVTLGRPGPNLPPK